jgi:hypothetical protein
VAIWSRRRRGKPGYVEPPEFRTNVIILFDGRTWHVSAANAADGRLPPAMRVRSEPNTEPNTEPNAEALADEFRTSWRNAAQGFSTAGDRLQWIRMLDESAGDLTEAWDRFFLAGGEWSTSDGGPSTLTADSPPRPGPSTRTAGRWNSTASNGYCGQQWTLERRPTDVTWIE